jgi:hypothetical protein
MCFGQGPAWQSSKKSVGQTLRNEILRAAQNDKFGRADSALGFFLSAKQIG